MGEIAEMMLGGLMCEGCGEVMDDFDEPGYPRRCVACQPRQQHRPAKPGRSAKRRQQRRRAAQRAAAGGTAA